MTLEAMLKCSMCKSGYYLDTDGTCSAVSADKQL